jgi:FKBP-type peptidyl-prolyl cis-trans isomerase FklB
MNKFFIVLIALVFMMPGHAFGQRRSSKKALAQEQPKTMQNELDSVSYAFGMLIGMNMKDVGFQSFNYELFSLAIQKVLEGADLPLDDETARLIVNEYVSGMMDQESSENMAKSLEYMAVNSMEDGVVSLESGLQYKILVEGDGPTPGPESKVMVHYTGMLPDGTVFDSSREMGEPMVIPLNMVIPGWTEALQLMPVGSRWMIYIPPQLGYGENSPPGSPIKSNSVLIFDVELISIEE